MLDALKNEVNYTRTENGALTRESSGSYCLDLFATIGATRSLSEKEIINRFIPAFTEHRDLAVKILFYARDVRGGLGERRAFRTILRWLADNEQETVRKNIGRIAEYGRYDDLLTLFDTPVEADMLSYIKERLMADVEAAGSGKEISLLAKWLPSVNTSSKDAVAYAKRIARSLGMTDREYRRILVSLRGKIRIIENNLRCRDYSFDYAKQPSRAMFKYRQAFIRNDNERYLEFIDRVERKEAKMHADALYPYELIAPLIDTDSWGCQLTKSISDGERAVLNATWDSLPDYTSDKNCLAIVDTSGSMYQGKHMPAAVALSLGIYIAEHNKGRFKNCFMEFSERPKLIELKGDDFYSKFRYISTFSEIANTNLSAVFNVILSAAVKNGIPKEEMPERLIIISDMEFDICVGGSEKTNFEYARDRYERYGYKLPDIVFWNVDSRHRQQPVTKNEEGVVLVSGFTPKLYEMVIAGKTPYEFMIETLTSCRYKDIVA